MSNLLKIYIVILIGFINQSFAQFDFVSEVGIIAGPVSFRSDYGERNDSRTNFGNTGYGIGLKYYLNFSTVGYGTFNSKSYFDLHFKPVAEISYSKTNLKHYGSLADKPANGSLELEQLQAMRGSSQVIDIGTNIEYFPFDLSEFGSIDENFAPFITAGIHYSFYSPKAYSLLGDNNTPQATSNKYYYATSNSAAQTISFMTEIGTRYKLNENSDILAELRMQYFMSDWVDGLRPNPKVYSENKSNDWLVWFNFGYVYYFK